MDYFDDINCYISFYENRFGKDVLLKGSYDEELSFLLSVKEIFPNEPWAYRILGEQALLERDYVYAFEVYSDMRAHLSGSSDSILGCLKSLVGMGDFDKAKELYYSESNLDFELKSDTALDLLNISAESGCLVEFNRSQFKDMFFLDTLINDDKNFFHLLSHSFLEDLYHEYIFMANEYVEKSGARFIYASIDNLFMVKNKSVVENEILSIGPWKKGFRRKTWISEIPPHIESMYSELPHFCPDYIKEIHSGPQNYFNGTKITASPYTSQYINISNGIRKTIPSIDGFGSRVLLFGGSDVYGAGAEDSHTISSFMQKLFIDSNIEDIKVENHGTRGNSIFVCINNLIQTKIHRGDTIIVFGYPKIFDKNKSLLHVENMHCHFSRPHTYGEIFFDHNHMNWKGNQVIANMLFDKVSSTPNKKQRSYIDTNRYVLAEKSLDLIKYLIFRKSSQTCEQGGLAEYLSYIRDSKVNVLEKANVGSVAVNCNPITLGHLHLLEYAASEVEHLYIFVIEEDKSYFSFSTRLSLVIEATKHISNITVLKGGRYICTQFTYPEYYSKEDETEVLADASMEAWFFSEFIAKELGITKIFLGEEPTCNVTKQYNATMLEVLPNYDIHVDIIPRISTEDNIISASKVREYLKEEDFSSIEKMVPTSTYEFLIREYSTSWSGSIVKSLKRILSL